MRAVVAGEEHNRVFLDAELLDLRKDGSNIAIEFRYHSGEVAIGLRPGLVLIRMIARKLHAVAGLASQLIIGMRRRIRQVEEERSRPCFVREAPAPAL